MAFAMTFSYSSLYSQIEVKPEIGFAGNFVAFGIYNSHNVEEVSYKSSREDSDYKYVGLNIYLGSRILIKNISLLFSFNYQHLASGGYDDNLTRIDFRKSDLLGVGLGMRLFESSKFRPFLSAQLFTEINSNYKNKFLKSRSYAPLHKQAPEYYNSYHPSHGNPSTYYYQATLYQTTQFLGNFYSGCDFSLVDNLMLNLSVGYNLTLLNYKYANFEYTNPKYVDYMEITSTSRIRTVALHSFSMELGLRYNFSMKKKPKAEIP